VEVVLKQLKNGSFLLVLTCGISLYACKEEPENTVAQVGDVQLTHEQVLTRIPKPFLNKVNPEEKHRMVEKWVEDELLYQEAKNQKLDQDSAVKSRIQEAERNLMIAELIERMYAKNAEISEGDIQNYYNTHVEAFQREQTEIRVRHILVEDRTALNTAMERLRNGESFEQIAREISKDMSAENGGDLGVFTEDMVDASFWEACLSTKLATPTRATTRLGYHVIEVRDRFEAGSKRKLEDVRDEIKQRILSERRVVERAKFLNEIRTRIKTVVHLDRLK
jgi:peptidyl-prolyl cis-trans isomerase C